MITNLRDQLIRDEGLRLRPYLDTVGKTTVGVGRCIDTNPLTHDEIVTVCGSQLSHDLAVEWIETHGITFDHAMLLLDHDIDDTNRALLAAQPWLFVLDNVRHAVFANMAFNMGVAGVGNFHNAIDASRRCEWQRAGREMLDSRWARQVGKRAHRLAEQMITGEWI